MKTTLTLAGLVVTALIYFLVTSILIEYTEATNMRAQGSELPLWYNLKFVLVAAVIIIPGHIYLVYKAYKKEKMDIAFAISFLVIPYMLGITIQAAIL